MSAIYILWLRQLKRYIRSRARIIGSLGQPLLFLACAGYLVSAPLLAKAVAGITSSFSRRESSLWEFSLPRCSAALKLSGTADSEVLEGDYWSLRSLACRLSMAGRWE